MSYPNGKITKTAGGKLPEGQYRNFEGNIWQQFFLNQDTYNFHGIVFLWKFPVMIQRIQSLFLLLSSVCNWLLFTLPFASSDGSTTGFLADMRYDIQDHVLLLGMVVLGGIISLGAIFLYNNRPLQLRVSYLSLILSILLPLLVVFLFYSEATKNFIAVHINDGPGIWLPLAGILFTVLAIRFIRKDEKLVRSMDRLR